MENAVFTPYIKKRVFISYSCDKDDLLLRNPKYLTRFSLSTSHQNLSRLNRLKIIRQVKQLSLSRKILLEKLLLFHRKTIKQITLASWVSLSSKSAKSYRQMDKYILNYYSPLSWKRLHTKQYIRVLQIEIFDQSHLETKDVSFLDNLSQMMKSLKRIRGLETIVLIFHNIGDRFGQFLRALEGLLPFLSPSLSIKIQIKEKFLEEQIYTNILSTTAKRIKRIANYSMEPISSIILQKLPQFTHLEALKLYLLATNDTLNQFLPLLSTRETLLYLDLYLDLKNALMEKHFLPNFRLPYNLKSIDLTIANVSPSSDKTILSQYPHSVQHNRIKALENVRLNISHMFGSHFPPDILLLPIIKDAPYLKSLHLSISMFSEEDVTGPPFSLGNLFSECPDLLASLQEITLEVPTLSFEDLSFLGDKDCTIPLKKILFYSWIDSAENLVYLLERVRPIEYNGSSLTFCVTLPSAQICSELIQAFTRPIYMENISLIVKVQLSFRMNILDELLSLLEKLEGPTQFYLHIPELRLTYDDHYLILEALEKSKKVLKKVTMEFGINKHENESKMVFELLEENYELSDYEFASEIESYSPMSSFESDVE